MTMIETTEGRLRPVVRQPLDLATVQLINTSAPAFVWTAPTRAWCPQAPTEIDRLWGPAARLVIAHATDPELRHLGASELIKSRQLLSRLRVQERDLAVFRYRGHGNPGATHVKTIGGEVRELTYERWDDEDTWRIQARCKICPDALGEGADLVAADCWEGGSPAGEDEGFNAILVRTRRGVELFDAAVRAEVVTVTREIGFRDMIASSPIRLKKARFYVKPRSLFATIWVCSGMSVGG